VLARGFTYTLDADGRPLTAAADVAPGDRLTTVFHDGSVHSTAEGERPSRRSDPEPPPRRRISKRNRRESDPSGGLFDHTP